MHFRKFISFIQHSNMQTSNKNSVRTFKENDLVFAKLRTHIPWPAIVLSLGAKKSKVRFYGEHLVGIADNINIFSYVENKDTYITPTRLKLTKFRRAVEEIEAEIRNRRSIADMYKNMLIAVIPSTYQAVGVIQTGTSDAEQLKLQLELGSIHPTDVKHHIKFDPDHSKLSKEVHKEIIERWQLYSVEVQFIKLSEGLSKCLHNPINNPKAGLRFVNMIGGLSLTRLMLLRNEKCVQAVVRGTNYLDDNRQEDVKILREACNSFLQKCSQILNFADKPFEDAFNAEVLSFKDLTWALCGGAVQLLTENTYNILLATQNNNLA